MSEIENQKNWYLLGWATTSPCASLFAFGGIRVLTCKMRGLDSMTFIS